MNKKKSITNIAYKGIVDVKLLQEGQILKKRVYHNRGVNLFDKLYSLIAGKSSISQSLPSRLALFTKDEYGQYVRISNFIPGEPVISEDPSNPGVTLQFLVPLSELSIVTTTTIDMFALFPDILTTDELNNILVQYEVADGALNVQSTLVQSTLAVEWTLSFTNA